MYAYYKHSVDAKKILCEMLISNEYAEKLLGQAVMLGKEIRRENDGRVITTKGKYCSERFVKKQYDPDVERLLRVMENREEN